MAAIIDAFTEMTDHDLLRNSVATFVLLVVIVGIRTVVARTISGADLPAERRRSVLVQSRNWAIVAFVAIAVFIWAQQLQTVALSLAAFGVALVLASKELIMCLSGTLLRMSTQGFSIGDRIEIGGVRGDVIDIGPLTTTVLEVGPGPHIHMGTGRKIVLPNSRFLSDAVTNETFTDDFVLHAATVRLERSEDWQKAEGCFLEAAAIESEAYRERALRNMSQVGRKHGLTPPSVKPRAWIQMTDAKHLELTVRFPAPARTRGQVEQAILRRFLSDFDGKK